MKWSNCHHYLTKEHEYNWSRCNTYNYIHKKKIKHGGLNYKVFIVAQSGPTRKEVSFLWPVEFEKSTAKLIKCHITVPGLHQPCKLL